MLRDSLGVPMEPKNDPHIPVARDWLDKVIYSDDYDEYIVVEGEYVLDEENDVRAYLLKRGTLYVKGSSQYIELDDYVVLDDYPNLRCHILDEMGGYLLNTMEIYNGVVNSDR